MDSNDRTKFDKDLRTPPGHREAVRSSAEARNLMATLQGLQRPKAAPMPKGRLA